MKKYMMALMFLVVGSGAFASSSMFDGMSKEELGNYEITITDKRTGQVVGRMSRAQYKVVSIDSSPITTQPVEKLPLDVQEAVDKLMERPRKDAKIAEKVRSGYNTVIVHAGMGKDGLNNSNDGKQYNVSEKDAVVGGATVCRSRDGAGLCGSAFTNKTFLMGLKFDF